MAGAWDLHDAGPPTGKTLIRMSLCAGDHVTAITLGLLMPHEEASRPRRPRWSA